MISFSFNSFSFSNDSQPSYANPAQGMWAYWSDFSVCASPYHRQRHVDRGIVLKLDERRRRRRSLYIHGTRFSIPQLFLSEDRHLSSDRQEGISPLSRMSMSCPLACCRRYPVDTIDWDGSLGLHVSGVSSAKVRCVPEETTERNELS